MCVKKKHLYNNLTFSAFHVKHAYFAYFRVMLQLNRPFVMCLIFTHIHSVQSSIIRQECHNSLFRMFQTHTHTRSCSVWNGTLKKKCTSSVFSMFNMDMFDFRTVLSKATVINSSMCITFNKLILAHMTKYVQFKVVRSNIIRNLTILAT
jgi:hypothetical protein